MSQFCISCGVENSDEAKFCKECGESLQIKEYAEFNSAEQRVEQEIVQNSTSNFFEFFFSWKGRIARKEFFLRGFIPITAFIFFYAAMHKVVELNLVREQINISQYLALSYMIIGLSLIVSYSMIAISVKRFHDYNSSAWNVILQFIPIINFIVLLFLLFTGGNDGANRYGKRTSYFTLSAGKWFFLIVNILFLFISFFLFITNNSMLKYLDSNKANKERQKEECIKTTGSWKFSYDGNDIVCTGSTINSSFSLTINTYPYDAKVYIMNIKPRYYDGMILKNGRYTIKVKKSGYVTQEGYVELDKDLQIDVSLERI